MIARFSSILGFIFLFSLFCFGQNSNYIIEEEWTTPPLFGMPGTTRNVKTWIAGNKIRRDEADFSQTVLIRPDLGKLWLIRPKSKTYLEMDRETLQGLSLMALMAFGIGIHSETGKPSIPDSLFWKTGRTLEIGSWNCYEVVVRRQQGKSITVWMSAETGLESGLYVKILKNMMGTVASGYEAFFHQLNRLEGYPVLIESGMGGRKLTQKLLGVQNQPIPDSVFEIPRGYQKSESVQN